MNSELVSVIIPTYNSQQTISTCLKSIQKQTYGSIEIIVVDGGSTDSTVEICNRYGVTVLETNLGMAAARKRGAKHASGTWLFHVDSDMELSDRVIEECVRQARDYDALIIPEINVGTTYWAQCTDIGKRVSRHNQIGNVRFFPRELYMSVGGHNSDLLNREDRELHEIVKQEGASIGHTTETIIHHLNGMGLRDILSKRMRYVQSLKEFEERSRVSEAQFDREKSVDVLDVLFIELFNRPKKIPGFLLITAINFIILRMVLFYNRVRRQFI
ncbi:glycosyltransferase family 2 protein [Haloarcula argentinensis]|nr:glycosyltransferase family 2 protein [Haloarcula argentinensis]